jgi:hypothetical protein
VDTTRAWLYVREALSMRVELQDGTITVYGPGEQCRRLQFTDNVDAMLELSRLEQDLVHDGWSLEQMTTERRSGQDRRTASRGSDRRRLKLIK